MDDKGHLLDDREFSLQYSGTTSEQNRSTKEYSLNYGSCSSTGLTESKSTMKTTTPSPSIFNDCEENETSESRHSTPLHTNYKRHGLTLESLDRLSPSMVTLQSLNSDWPPNTVDSGYEPSPCGNYRFTYPIYDQDSSSSEAENPPTNESNRIVSINARKSKEQCFYKNADDKMEPNQNVKGYTNNKKATPSPTSFESCKSPLVSTPPINIPSPKVIVNQQYYMSSISSFQQITKQQMTRPFTTKSPETFTLSGDDSYDDQTDEITPLPTGFRRPRAYSCPETCRPTPTRPPVPLYPTTPCHNSNSAAAVISCTNFATGVDSLSSLSSQHQANCQNSAIIHHARYRSTPVSTQITTATTPQHPAGANHNSTSTGTKTVNHILPPTPTNQLQAGRSRVHHLSGDGPGHRRRVLVLAFPDVVVDTSPAMLRHPYVTSPGSDVTSPGSYVTSPGNDVNHHQKQTTPPSATQTIDAVTACHSRQSSADDMIAPLRHGTPRPPRPRALSCDVTMEETVGRALRKMADDLEIHREVREPQTLFGRFRRSFRRSFSGIMNIETGTNETPTSVSANTSSAVTRENDARLNNSLPIPGNRRSSAQTTTRQYRSSPSDDADNAFYDLQFLIENDSNTSEPKYTLTRRGGLDDFEIYL